MRTRLILASKYWLKTYLSNTAEIKGIFAAQWGP